MLRHLAVDPDSKVDVSGDFVVGDERRIVTEVNLGAFEAEFAAFLLCALSYALALTQQWENLQDGGFAGTVATAENGERGEAKRPGFVGEQPDIS